MKRLLSPSSETLLAVKLGESEGITVPVQFNEYSVFIVQQGEGVFYSDFNVLPFTGPVILFTTPLQMIRMEPLSEISYSLLQFHGDFYCIEYHREEVACNGLLFNNIYIEPSIILTPTDALVFAGLMEQIVQELTVPNPSQIVLKSIVQLFLAKCSQIKLNSQAAEAPTIVKDGQMEEFKRLLEENFLTLHKPSDYAGLLAMTTNNLTKRSTKYFRKTPSQLITERLILEAKKQLHLTRKSIKEIAYSLHFEDEFYFSRVFKKHTLVSPQAFRDKTGISIVADLYR
ncbi:helix-turn-helix domain-containing protein [Flavobacterium beibuense]|uniref:Transcriptional regulator, AraC family n=1 Tax=Flavobacterium beibuense TaxID=657326 RepID=A0A444WEL7_9FLAO|nr:helix-turn-helix domain-containing protein [Flavobacterium beibuense]RYJ44222.1 Transcriptional regulator, AraC family [Flavobacterium beibuense]